MTTRTSSRIHSFLKATVIVCAVAAGLLVAAKVWSIRILQNAQADFAAVSSTIGTMPQTCSDAQLRAAAAIVPKLDMTREEKKSIGSLTTLPLEQWTEENDALVIRVADRNRDTLDAIAQALVSEPPETAALSGPSDSDDRLDRSPIEIHLRLMSAARFFATKARLAIKTGHGEQATRHLVPLLHISQGLEVQGRFLDVIMGSAIEGRLNRCLLELVQSPIPMNPGNQKLISDLVPTVDLMEALRMALTAETSHWVDGWEEAEPDASLRGMLIGPLSGPIIKRLFQAAFLESGTHLLELIDTSFGTSPEAFNSPPRPPWWRPIQGMAWTVQPNMINTIRRCQATTALRQLLQAALVMRTTSWPGDAYPEKRPTLPVLTQPDVFSGQVLEYTLLDEGRLHLAIVDGPELFETIRSTITGTHHQLDPVQLDPPQLTAPNMSPAARPRPRLQ